MSSSRTLGFFQFKSACVSARSGFPIGSELYYIQRLHFLDGQALILNHNYFLKEVVPGLTPEIGAHSIYQYLEETLHLSIINSKRVMTIEKMTQIDEKYMDLNSDLLPPPTEKSFTG